MKTEKDVKRRVKALCEQYEAYYAMPQTGGYGRSGVPDFLICCNGHFIAVETKFGPRKPTTLQSAELRKVQQAGGATLVCREDNLHALEALLHAAKSGRVRS